MEYDLKPSQEKYAALLARGLTQADAYRQSHAVEGVNPQRISERACKLAAKDQVKARVQALLSEAKVSDLLSAGTAISKLLEDMEGARAAKNWTALASFHRLSLQVLGLLKENIVLTEEERLTDEELIKRLAVGDPGTASMLRNMIGSADEFVQ